MSRMPYTQQFSKLSITEPTTLDAERIQKIKDYIEDFDFYLFFFTKDMEPEEVDYSTDSELDQSVDIDDFTSSADSSVRIDSPAPEIDADSEDRLLEQEEVNEAPRTNGNCNW